VTREYQLRYDVPQKAKFLRRHAHTQCVYWSETVNSLHIDFNIFWSQHSFITPLLLHVWASFMPSTRQLYAKMLKLT